MVIEASEGLDYTGVADVTSAVVIFGGGWLGRSSASTTAGGKLDFHVFGALAEFERSIMRERTKAGLEAARARG